MHEWRRVSLFMTASFVFLLLVVVVVAVHLSMGGFDGPAFAHILTPLPDGSTPTHLEIDMDPTNGSGPCNPVDDRASIGAGSNYDVAICLTSARAEPAGFQFELVYDDTADQCVPVSPACTGPCLDANPDANTGSTTFSTPSLGPIVPSLVWDCSSSTIQPPTCDKDGESGPAHGRAFMQCLTLGEPTLPIGQEVSSPIAEVRMKALAFGAVTLALQNVQMYAPDLSAILTCDDPATYDTDLCFDGIRQGEILPSITPTIQPSPTGCFGCLEDCDADGHGGCEDNCPQVYNPDQLNTDAKPIDNGPDVPGDDVSVPNDGHDSYWPFNLGDACDYDDDNDWMFDTGTNQTLGIPGEDAGCGAGPTNPKLMDSDGDTVGDGAECLLGSDPTDPLSKPAALPPNDSDGDGLPDAVEALFGCDPNKTDTDGDGVPDGVEVKGWATSPTSTDTDADSCDDNIEIADVNGDYRVNVGDQLIVAKAAAGRIGYNADFDLTKDGRINVGDQLLVAHQAGKSCR